MFGVDAMLISYPAQAVVDAGRVEVTLPTEQTCRIHFPWRTPCGLVMISTSSLPQRALPYPLEVELARGTLGLFSEKFSEWNEAGTTFSDELQAAVDASRDALVEAIYETDATRAAECATAAIDLSLSTVSRLVSEFITFHRCKHRTTGLRISVDQATFQSALKHQDEPDVGLPVWQFDRISLLLPDENDQTMEQDTAYIDSCFEQLRGLRTSTGTGDTQVADTTLELGVGPILDWKNVMVDQWFHGEDDFEAIRNNVFRWGHAFAGKVNRSVSPIYIASGIGARNSSKFSDHQRLQLTLDMLTGVHDANPDFRQMVSFYQPVGSEIDMESKAVSPLHAADALLRTDVGLAQIGLEISFANHDRPSMRLPLNICGLISAWKQFDLPLVVVVELPAVASLSDAQKCSDQRLDMNELKRILSLLYANHAVEEVLLCRAASRTLPPSSDDSATMTFVEIVRELHADQAAYR